MNYFDEICSRNPPEYPRGENGKFQCPCCRYFTLDECNAFDICPVCFWEDDGATNDEDFSGPNGMMLAEGKEAYRKNGYVSDDIKKHVRKPLESESRGTPESESK